MDELRLRAALQAGDQADIDALFSAVFGTLPHNTVFHRNNLSRILENTPAFSG